MKKIPISEIENDMILAKPLTRSDGNILMAAGVKLKANMASRLQNWGIAVAYIEDEEEEGTADKDELLKQKLERLDAVFEGTLGNVHMNALYAAVKEYMAK